MIPAKGRWTAWAREWGLSCGAHGGIFHRTEDVAGRRNSLLFRAIFGERGYPILTVIVRFPRTNDVQRLRERLADDTTLDALSGKARTRRAVRVVAPTISGTRWSRPAEYILSEASLTWRKAFPWARPDPVLVQGWVDTLVAAVARATPVFGTQCETCGLGGVERHVLVDGVPMLLCTGCQQRTQTEGEMAERAYEMTEANHGAGAMLAGMAAVAGAVCWAALSLLTQREFAAAAIGIGALVAWAYRRGADRVDGLGRFVSAALTLMSVTLGEILLFAWWVAKARPDIGYRIDAGLQTYRSAWRERPGDQAITLLFACLGAWVAFKALEKPQLRRTIQSADGSPTGDEVAR